MTLHQDQNQPNTNPQSRRSPLTSEQQLEVVIDIEHELAASLDQQLSFEILRKGIQRLFPDINALFISSFDAERQMIKALFGIDDNHVFDVSNLPEIPLAPQGQGTQSMVIHTRQPLVINSGLEEKLRKGSTLVRIGGEDGLFTQAALYVPMLAQDNVLGVIQLQSMTPNRFKDEDIRALTLIANTAAVSIQNARLYETAQREIAERRRVEEQLRKNEVALRASEEMLIELNRTLEERVRQRTAEAQMINRDLERALRTKDEFLASMSHELRTPLTGILGMTEGMLEEIYGPLTDRQKRAMTNIENSGRHLLDLINDILDISKMEAGKIELVSEPFQLLQVCQASLQLIKGMAHKKNHKISFAIHPADMRLVGDSRRIKQIMVNLLSNAVKFTPPEGKLGLEVTGYPKDERVELVVWDTGIGIKPEDMDKLFQPFVQLDSSLSRQQTGTGLGLTLVQNLTELHRGSVQVESTFGEGSRFTISLPWNPASAMSETGAADPGRSAGSKQPGPPPDSPPAGAPLIMVVDDHEVNIEMMSEFLLASDFRVASAPSGSQFLQIVNQLRPALVLMDIQMPGMNGLETIRQLRQNDDPAIAATPLIAITALTMPGDREKCLGAGANEYISKPVHMQTIVEQIKHLLAPGPTA